MLRQKCSYWKDIETPKYKKEKKNRNKVCNLTKQVKAKFPTKKLIYDDVSKTFHVSFKTFLRVFKLVTMYAKFQVNQ